MEELIQKSLIKLRMEYVVFWVVPFIIVLVSEYGVDWVGIYADNIRVAYFFETIGILLVASCVPLALKLFSWVLTKKIDVVSFPDALRLYSRWSSVRLGILELAVLVNIFTYYLTLSNTGLLCAFITLIASLFCIPGEKRLREELHINKEDSI